MAKTQFPGLNATDGESIRTARKQQAKIRSDDGNSVAIQASEAIGELDIDSDLGAGWVVGEADAVDRIEDKFAQLAHKLDPPPPELTSELRRELKQLLGGLSQKQIVGDLEAAVRIANQVLIRHAVRLEGPRGQPCLLYAVRVPGGKVSVHLRDREGNAGRISSVTSLVLVRIKRQGRALVVAHRL